MACGFADFCWSPFSWKNRDFGSSIKQLGGSPGAGLPGVFHQDQFGSVLPCGSAWEGDVGLVGNTPAPTLSSLCVRDGSAWPFGAVNVCVAMFWSLGQH